MTVLSRSGAAVAALSLMLLSSGSALAQEKSVLTGADAFGGWRDDAPGTQRLLTADDLAAAAAETGSASNAPSTIVPPDGAQLSVPDGFEVEQVVSGLRGPRTLAFAPNGDLFVANSRMDEILVFRFADGASEPVESEVFVTRGLNQPYGIAFYPEDNPQWVYVANTDGLVRYPYDGGMAAAGEVEELVDDIPTGGHWTRSIAFSPDGGTLYYSVGSESNVAQRIGTAPQNGLDAWREAEAFGAAWGNEAGRALVYAMSPDGSDRRVLATGLRNCSGMDVQPVTGDVWCAVNERDALGNNIPFDYVTSVAEGAFYGWPWFFIGGNEDPRQAGVRPDLADDVTVPDVLLQSHSAPLNVTFYDTDAWGSDYEGDAFVALHGSWNRDPRTGYKIARLIFEDGEATGVYEDFVTGFVVSDGAVWGRPVGVAVSPDGDLYFSEDGNGTIWRVSKSGS